MRKTKSILSLFLALVMAVSSAVAFSVSSYAKEAVKTVNCIVTEPAVGSTVAENRYATVKYNPAGAGSNKAYTYWFESDTGKEDSFMNPMEETDTFKKDKYYMASPDPGELNEGYEYTSSTQFLINGETSSMGAVIFGPLGSAAPKTKITGVKNKTYTGKALTQKPTVKIGTKTLKAGKDYKLSYKNNKNVGTATMTVTFIGSYKGTTKKTFRINPKSTSLTKVTAGKKSFIANWKKQATQTTGYQIQYSTSSNFKKPKTVTIKGNKNVKKEIKKLTSKKKYFVRVRTYKVVSKKKFYGKWSKALSVTVK